MSPFVEISENKEEGSWEVFMKQKQPETDLCEEVVLVVFLLIYRKQKNKIPPNSVLPAQINWFDSIIAFGGKCVQMEIESQRKTWNKKK